MLSPKLLEIEGFRSFKNKTSISFPERGAVLISGSYKNSSLSSGSGKSSIPLAISFALGIAKLPATDLKNWESKKMRVSLTLTDGTNDYVIVRDPKLSLVVNGQPYDGLSTGAEEKLTQILQAKPEIVDALVNRAQRVPGRFINATDSAKKEFLSPLLRLDALESASEQFGAELDQHQRSLEMTRKEIEIYSNAINSISVTQDDINIAAAQYQAAKDKLQELQLSVQETEINNQLSLIRQELSKVEAVKRQVQMAQYENGTLRNNIMALQQEIARLKEQVCPTCNREWDQSVALLEQKLDQQRKMAEKMQVNQSVVKNSEAILNQESVLSAEQQRLSQLLGQQKAPIAQAAQLVSMSQYNLSNLTNQFNQKAAQAAKIESSQSRLIDLENKMKVLQLTVELIGRNGFLGSIFDEVLQEIETRINDMLVEIPNVNTFMIEISSTSVTKTGTTKKAISTILHKNGKEVSIKTLSGGQMCSLELCADLAVREAICSRSGTSLGWLSLDEAMDGMDVDCKQAALNIIKSKVKGLILIIDHSTEVKEGFEKIVEVEYDGKNSTIVS